MFIFYATEYIGESEAIKKEYWQSKLDSFRMSIFFIVLTRSKEVYKYTFYPSFALTIMYEPSSSVRLWEDQSLTSVKFTCKIWSFL